MFISKLEPRGTILKPFSPLRHQGKSDSGNDLFNEYQTFNSSKFSSVI